MVCLKVATVRETWWGRNPGAGRGCGVTLPGRTEHSVGWKAVLNKRCVYVCWEDRALSGVEGCTEQEVCVHVLGGQSTQWGGRLNRTRGVCACAGRTEHSVGWKAALNKRCVCVCWEDRALSGVEGCTEQEVCVRVLGGQSTQWGGRLH